MTGPQSGATGPQSGATSPLASATGLLAGAISYALSVCALVRPGEMALPTPCAEWDLGMLLGHLGDSMADLETAIRTGHLDLDRPAGRADVGRGVGDPVEVLRDRAAQLLCSSYCYAGPERLVAVADLPLPAGLVACTGAVEIAVHGWDVSAARGRAEEIPPGLAVRMLALSPLLVTSRAGLFAPPVEVPPQAGPGDRLVAYLGRHP